jgi:dissimilatory sulfite reductase (desulfoviridin) alpha/beta subunit
MSEQFNPLENTQSGKIDISALKAGGYMKQKQPDLFAVRVKALFGNLTSMQVTKIAELAEKYGNGEIHLTVRQGVEIPFVHFDNLRKLTDELKDVGLVLGACGPRFRCVTSCQGSTLCVHALGNTQDLAGRIDERFYGRGGHPHKFKVGLTGCTFSCAKPHENDAGFMAVVEPKWGDNECISCGLCAETCPSGAITMGDDGHPVFDRAKCINCGECIFCCPTGSWEIGKQGWNAYVGGKYGREPQLGLLLKKFVPDDEVLELVEALLSVYKKLGKPRERFGNMINRVGLEQFKEEVKNEQSAKSTA